MLIVLSQVVAGHGCVDEQRVCSRSFVSSKEKQILELVPQGELFQKIMLFQQW